MTKSVVVFCPNQYSLYTCSICELLLKKGYSIELIIVKRLTVKRFIEEYKRDGKKLLTKIWNKLIYRNNTSKNFSENIQSFRQKNNLNVKNVKGFTKNGSKILFCNSLNDIIVETALSQIHDKFVVFTGGGIIRKNILDVSGDGVLNCHMGILPKFRGMDIPSWCILEDKINQLGITIHFMDPVIDTGSILRTIPIKLNGVENIKSLYDKFEKNMVEYMVDTIEKYVLGYIIPTQQSKNYKRQYFILHNRLVKLTKIKLNNTISNQQIYSSK